MPPVLPRPTLLKGMKDLSVDPEQLQGAGGVQGENGIRNDGGNGMPPPPPPSRAERKPKKPVGLKKQTGQKLTLIANKLTDLLVVRNKVENSPLFLGAISFDIFGIHVKTMDWLEHKLVYFKYCCMWAMQLSNIASCIRSESMRNGYLAELDARAKEFNDAKQALEANVMLQVDDAAIEADPEMQAKFKSPVDAVDQIVPSYNSTIKTVRLAIDTPALFNLDEIPSSKKQVAWSLCTMSWHFGTNMHVLIIYDRSPQYTDLTDIPMSLAMLGQIWSKEPPKPKKAAKGKAAPKKWVWLVIGMVQGCSLALT